MKILLLAGTAKPSMTCSMKVVFPALLDPMMAATNRPSTSPMSLFTVPAGGEAPLYLTRADSRFIGAGADGLKYNLCPL